jgi:hypothetical protein
MLSKYVGETGKSESAVEVLKRLLSELDNRREFSSFGGDEYIAVDIDGTIATKIRMGKYPEDYMKKQPIKGSIEGLRRLRRLGYKIMLFTARKEEDRSWTEGWLMSNGFSGLYDVLIMDKPWFTALIDDRAIGFTGDWDRAINEFKSRFYMGDEGQEK